MINIACSLNQSGCSSNQVWMLAFSQAFTSGQIALCHLYLYVLNFSNLVSSSSLLVKYSRMNLFAVFVLRSVLRYAFFVKQRSTKNETSMPNHQFVVVFITVSFVTVSSSPSPTFSNPSAATMPIVIVTNKGKTKYNPLVSCECRNCTIVFQYASTLATRRAMKEATPPPTPVKWQPIPKVSRQCFHDEE